MFIWFVIVWLLVGFLITEVLLRGHEQRNPDSAYRGRIGILVISVVLWPIHIYFCGVRFIQERREKDE